MPSFVILCMGLVLYVHHSICLTYHLSSEALPVCFRIKHLLSTKTGHIMRFSGSSLPYLRYTPQILSFNLLDRLKKKSVQALEVDVSNYCNKCSERFLLLFL